MRHLHDFVCSDYTSPSTGGSIRDVSCQFPCSMPKIFKIHILRLQVTSDTTLFLLESSIPLLVLVRASEIPHVNSCATFLRNGKHV